LFRSSTTSC
jgi:hypothetical protein